MHPENYFWNPKCCAFKEGQHSSSSTANHLQVHQHRTDPTHCRGGRSPVAGFGSPGRMGAQGSHQRRAVPEIGPLGRAGPTPRRRGGPAPSAGPRGRTDPEGNPPPGAEGAPPAPGPPRARGTTRGAGGRCQPGGGRWPPPKPEAAAPNLAAGRTGVRPQLGGWGPAPEGGLGARQPSPGSDLQRESALASRRSAFPAPARFLEKGGK